MLYQGHTYHDTLTDCSQQNRKVKMGGGVRRGGGGGGERRGAPVSDHFGDGTRTITSDNMASRMTCSLLLTTAWPKLSPLSSVSCCSSSQTLINVPVLIYANWYDSYISDTTFPEFRISEKPSVPPGNPLEIRRTENFSGPESNLGKFRKFFQALVASLLYANWCYM